MIDYDFAQSALPYQPFVESADNSSEDIMFDSLAEIALTSQNALSDHSVTQLLRGWRTFRKLVAFGRLKRYLALNSATATLQQRHVDTLSHQAVTWLDLTPLTRRPMAVRPTPHFNSHQSVFRQHHNTVHYSGILNSSGSLYQTA